MLFMIKNCIHYETKSHQESAASPIFLEFLFNKKVVGIDQESVQLFSETGDKNMDKSV